MIPDAQAPFHLAVFGIGRGELAGIFSQFARYAPGLTPGPEFASLWSGTYEAIGPVVRHAEAVVSGTSRRAPPPRSSSRALKVIAIDVEGGAATLYLTPEGKSLLIDTGWPAGMGEPRGATAASGSTSATQSPAQSSAERIIAAARKAGLHQIDYVLITHYHVDHVGGFGELFAKFPIGTVLDHGPNREQAPANLPAAYAAMQPATLYPAYERLIAGHARRSLKPGDRVAIGSMTLTAVSSDREVLERPLVGVGAGAEAGAGAASAACATMAESSTDGGEENARSLGVLLNYGKARIVALGDLTWNLEKALVCPINRVGRADLLIVSHHGSRLSNSPALLQALSPRVAVMDNGALKGGDAESYDTLSAAPGLQRLWQLHYALKAGPAHNAGEAYIANLSDEPDGHAALIMSVLPDGTVTVVNERSGFSETYDAAPHNR
jgi:beta-lactamase superfamily II metal-dependent hydrolase